MITFYFDGHNFEYEVKNCLRIFDLNIPCVIKEKEFLKDNSGIGIYTSLEKKHEGFDGYTGMYRDNVLILEARINSGSILLEKENDKKLKKTLVVKSMYQVLSEYYNMKNEYGILTGVRPVKILFSARKNGKSTAEISDILKSTYEVSAGKIELLWDVFKAEEKYICPEENDKNYNLYVGIPFCPSRCSYCSFTSFTGKEGIIDRYMGALLYETEKTIELAVKKGLRLNSVYIGGGTPSVLNESQISSIFDVIKKYYDLSSIKEISFEAGRPDTITEEKLRVLRNNCVSRISINPQSMKQETLYAIGRNHSVEDIREKYEMARKAEFNSINMDIILGLQGEDEGDAAYTIDELLKLRPDNITVHSLSYKTGSELKAKSVNQLTKDYELMKKMHNIVDRRCIEAGYKPYYMYRQKNIKGNLENVGYTVPGKESIYNIVIIEEIETILACGAGVSSKIMTGEDRHDTVYGFKSLDEYLARIDEIINKKSNILNIRYNNIVKEE